MSNNNTPVNIDLLISYAHGLAKPEDAARIRALLQEDEQLMGQYEGILYLMETYPDRDPAEILDEMTETVDAKLNKEPIDKKKDNRFIRVWKPFAVAASVLLVAGLGIFIALNQKRDPVSIASVLLKEPYTNSKDVDRNATERGEADSSWYADIATEDYPAALLKLSALPDSSQDARTAFYYGLCCLKIPTPQTDQAQAHFEKAAAQAGDYQQDAQYYLGIIELLKKNTAAAKEYLAKANTQKAKEVLKRLP